jgi:hypothetical protein
VEVIHRLKSNAEKQKSKALQRAIEKTKVREDFIIVVVEGNASTTNQTIATYAQKVTLTLHKFTTHEGIDYQKKVIKNALNNIFYNKQCWVL